MYVCYASNESLLFNHILKSTTKKAKSLGSNCR